MKMTWPAKRLPNQPMNLLVAFGARRLSARRYLYGTDGHNLQA